MFFKEAIIMDIILLLVYAALGYWAFGYLFYRNIIVIGKTGSIFGQRLFGGLLFGWILIPIAIIKYIFVH